MASRTDPAGVGRARPSGDGDAFPQVLAAAKVGAGWALTSLYREFHPGLLRYVRDDDVAADVWIAVARGITRFDGDGTGFRRWIFTIARRRLIDRDRKQGRRKTEPADPVVLRGVADTAADPATSAVDDLLGDEAAELIRAVLPPKQADVVLLRVVAGLDVRGVAEVVGRSPAAVSVLLHRALRRLATELANDDGHLARRQDAT